MIRVLYHGNLIKNLENLKNLRLNMSKFKVKYPEVDYKNLNENLYWN